MTLTPSQWETVFNVTVGLAMAITTALNIRSNKRTQTSNEGVKISNNTTQEKTEQLHRLIDQERTARFQRQPVR